MRQACRIAWDNITPAMAARRVQPIVRGQFVVTSRRPTFSSGAVAMRSCRGTERKTVLPSTTASTTAPIHGSNTDTPSGRATNNVSVVTPSTAIGSPTTHAVRRWCSIATAGARSTPMVDNNG